MENQKETINEKIQILKQSKHKTIIFGVSGSVATIKAKEIIEGLLKLGLNVVFVPTDSSQHFLKIPEFSIDGINIDKEGPVLVCFDDKDEWAAWNKREDYVLHIELRKIASILLIAPLSANTMGKIANGLCDNLLTCIARCWDIKHDHFIVAPAMNTMMYEHPITDLQLKMLSETLKIKVLPTLFKKLMCGDKGLGAMLDVPSIISEVELCVS